VDRPQRASETDERCGGDGPATRPHKEFGGGGRNHQQVPVVEGVEHEGRRRCPQRAPPADPRQQVRDQQRERAGRTAETSRYRSTSPTRRPVTPMKTRVRTGYSIASPTSLPS
jgi:hypothetical protein